MNRTDALTLLGESRWLSRCPPEFRDAILQRCLLRPMRRGEVLMSIGAEPAGLIAIVQGMARLETAPNARGPYTGFLIHPGEWNGAAAVITGGNQAVGLIATRAGWLAQVPPAAIADLTYRMPQAWRWIGTLLALNMMTALGLADDLMIRSPLARFAAVLLRLAGQRPPRPDALAEIDVTQGELAQMVNLSRATVALFLSRFESEGLVQRGYGCLHLLDVDGLGLYALSEEVEAT